MTYDEVSAVLAAFRIQHPDVFLEASVHAVGVAFEPEPHLEIRLLLNVEPPPRIKALTSQQLSYSFEGYDRSVKITFVHTDQVRAHSTTLVAAGTVHGGGDPARDIDLPGIGTGGWTFYLDDVLVCLSCWHVFCARGNATVIGQPVELNFQRVAHVRFFFPIYPNTRNLWDLALAAYDDTTVPIAQMRSCDDGFVVPYPRKFSEDINPGGSYKKVGNRLPTCRSGSLTGVYDVLVDYPGIGSLYFQQQLVFTKMSDPGDSGSVALDNRDNSVAGLIFAGSPSDTLANPIFRLGWTFAGTRVVNNVELPAFVRPKPVSEKGAASTKGQPDPFPSVQTPPLPPIFVVGQKVNFSGQTLVVTQLLHEWGLFSGNIAPGVQSAWIHIPTQTGFWAAG